MSEGYLEKYAARVGYSQEEAEMIGPDDPRRRHIQNLARAAGFYSIVAEVEEARHCNTGYQAGDRFVLDVDGNFIANKCPKRLCVYLASQLVVPVAVINERLSERIDPTAFHFMRRVRCPDCGVEKGGYGQVTVKISVVPRSNV